MCGIAGVVKFGEIGGAPWHAGSGMDGDFSGLEKMSAAIAHRGPDGSGVWVDPRAFKMVGLVHRRLAIIDLAGGAQPMGNEDGRVQVVFNGEIYNHAELRKELIGKGHRFATDHSDTEVLVHGWEEWGVELPGKLRGMFAFGVWDWREGLGRNGGAADTLFLARDRMGQKPLFYATLEDGVVFGSTIGSVLAWSEVPRRVPGEQIGVYLRLGYVPAPGTIWRDISQVIPGGWLRVRGEMMDGGIYWENTKHEIRNTKRELTEVIAEVRGEVMRSVESQLVSDVPLACFLSGGIDSSIVAAVMQKVVRERGGAPIRTMSVGFTESGFDETGYAAEVAKRIGSVHTRIEIGADGGPEGVGVMGILRELMRKGLGQPFADSSIVPTYGLSRAVRGIAPVALSGDGADELFGGYDRYRAMGVLSRWSGVVRWVPAGAMGFRGGKSERGRRLKAATRERDVGERYTRLTEIFTVEDVEALVGESGDWEHADFGGATAVRGAMLRDQREYLPGDVLWKVDAASMHEGLEVRSPFLDHGVVEMANGLPEGMLMKGGVGKWILREAFQEELPVSVSGRGKKGFAVPMEEWFKGELRGEMEEMILSEGSFVRGHLDGRMVEKMVREHMEGVRDHGLRLFSLVMLEIWAGEFLPVVE